MEIENTDGIEKINEVIHCWSGVNKEIKGKVRVEILIKKTENIL